MFCVHLYLANVDQIRSSQFIFGISFFRHSQLTSHQPFVQNSFEQNKCILILVVSLKSAFTRQICTVQTLHCVHYAFCIRLLNLVQLFQKSRHTHKYTNDKSTIIYSILGSKCDLFLIWKYYKTQLITNSDCSA